MGCEDRLIAVKNLVIQEDKAMAKRGMNIYKRKDGRWEGRIRRKSPQNGAKYKSVYGRSYKEVKEKMIVFASLLEEEKQKRCLLTIEQIVNTWMRDKKVFWKESTYACYRHVTDCHIIRNIGQERGETFNNAAFEAFLNGIQKKRDGSRISEAYARNISTILRQAFAYVSEEYHYKLPVLKKRRTAPERKTEEIPSDDTMKKLMSYLAENAGNPTCIGILLACCTGIRIGELCALKWEDINLETGILRIDKNLQRIRIYEEEGSGTYIRLQSPKTRTSQRNIPVPDNMLQLLAKSQKQGGEYLIAGKKKAWAESRTVQYRFATILKECGIKHFKFHMLRHYFASRCVRKGFDVKSLSEILGHASIQVTLNLYVHTSIDQKRILMNAAFGQDS